MDYEELEYEELEYEELEYEELEYRLDKIEEKLNTKLDWWQLITGVGCTLLFLKFLNYLWP